MHRNTFRLVLFLAIFAALLVGFHLGRRFPEPVSTQQQPTAQATAAPTPVTGQFSIDQKLSVLEYRNDFCGVAFLYPGTLAQVEGATGSAVFVSQEKPEESLIVTCQKDIPRPALPQDRIETATFSGVTARRYRDISAKDGSPIETLIFRHPRTGLDVFIAGSGAAFEHMLASLTIR